MHMWGVQSCRAKDLSLGVIGTVAKDGQSKH